MKWIWVCLVLAACGDDVGSDDGLGPDDAGVDDDMIDAPSDDDGDGEPDSPTGEPLTVTKTMVGTPDYTVTDPFMVACTVGTLESQFLEAIDCFQALIPQHAYDDESTVFASTTPHGPPYAGEQTAASFHTGNEFTFAEWDAPMGLVVTYQIIPTASAPTGMTQDGVQPMIPDSLELLYGADLLRDGTIVDADFDPPGVAASSLDAAHEGYSHLPVFHPENTVFITEAEARGTYTWTFEIRDNAGEGWDVTAGPFTVE